MKISIEFKLAKPWVSPNFFNRLHFGAQARLRQSWAQEMRSQTAHLNLAPMNQVEMTAYRIAARRLDYDNLIGGLKPIIDVMKVQSKKNPHGIGLILEDRREIMDSIEAHDLKPSDEQGAGSIILLTGEITNG